MRDFKGMKRQRGRNRGGGQPSGKPQQNANRAFDSTGPENTKVRGHAQSVYEKYQQLARDAFSSGDRVLAEGYLQHAEHYFRLLRLIQPNRPMAEIVARDTFASGIDIDFEEEPTFSEAPAEAEPASSAEGAPESGFGAEPRDETAPDAGRPRYEDRNRDRYQNDRNDRDRNDRYQADRDRGDRSFDRDRQERDRSYSDRGDRGQNRGDRDRFAGDRGQNERGQNDRYQGDRAQGERYQGDRSQGERQDRGDRFNGERRDGRDRNRARDDRPRDDRPREDRQRAESGYGEARADRSERRYDRDLPQGVATTSDERGRYEPAEAADVPSAYTGAPRSPEPVSYGAEAAGGGSAAQLRSEDGAVSEAPAFLQAMAPAVLAPAATEGGEEDGAPARRPRRTRTRRPAETAGDGSPAPLDALAVEPDEV